MRYSFNYRFVLKTVGFILIIESIFMMLATIISFYSHEMEGDAMLISSAITFFSGIFIRLIGTDDYERPITKRESFLTVTLTWVALSFFGMLPFYISGVIPNITDAFFETISGFTTTGATIMTDIDNAPRGLLFWRSMTQWIGGIGIIVFALAIIPILGGNASVLYDAEATGIVHERFQPRVTQIAKHLWGIYVFITILLTLLLWAGPMNLFDSICHAMSTVATGGFSTKQASIAHWDSPYIQYVMSIFMFIGGINFALIFFLIKGLPKKLFRNEEFRWYAWVVLIFTVVFAIGQYLSGKYSDVEEVLRTSLFHVISGISSTAFTTENYTAWGSFYVFMMCILMLFCASSGSTSGGIKIVRVIVLFKNTINEFKRQVHPTAILPVRINGQVVPMDAVTKVLAFMFLYVGILVISCVVLSLTGMSFESSVGASIASISNIGAGLGSEAETGHFANISAGAKWYMGFIMLVGRLELFTVLSLFMPSFWKK